MHAATPAPPRRPAAPPSRRPTAPPSHHPVLQVRLFVVHDAASGARTGHFYMDLHPREGKYGHAAIFHLLKRNGSQTAVDCMMCNLPATSSDGTPALLRHSDVVTFFHEFGHIMHGLCAEGNANQTRYAKCPRDFVEAPSQMLENWCWQPSVLARLSKHYETGEALPQVKITACCEVCCLGYVTFTFVPRTPYSVRYPLTSTP